MAKFSCRKAFSDEILSCAKKDSSIYMVTTDSRGSVTSSSFFSEVPDQTVELGIAEQNAVSFSAGLAFAGKNVFVCGPACFLTGRAYEQIKVDVAYNETNVKVVGVSAGVSYGPLGTTHTSLHDISCLRALPGIDIWVPCDAVQTKWITRHLARSQGPAYLRIGRGDAESVYDSAETFEPGKAKCLRNGSDVVLIACGEMVYQALCAAELLHQYDIESTVLDIFSIRPFDDDAVVKAAEKAKCVLTVEEHSVFGGLGELTAHVLSERKPTRMRILGFPDEQYRIGSQEELLEAYSLNAHGIAEIAERLIKE